MNLADLRTETNKVLAEYQHAARTVKEERQALKEAEQHVQDVAEAQKVIQDTAQTVQQIAHDGIASVVTRCLEAIADEPYTFKIDFQQKRNRTEAKLTFLRDEEEIDPVDGAGGGMIAVAAFALRLSAILLSKPKRRRLMVLDEPFGMLSALYSDRLREMLETLAEDLQVQFIIVTHNERIATGKVVELG